MEISFCRKNVSHFVCPQEKRVEKIINHTVQLT